MNPRIETNLKNIDVDQLFNLYQQVGLVGGLARKGEKEKIIEAFKRSYKVVAAYDDRNLVGAARMLSDGICYGMVYDVGVLPEYQGKGIGKSLMDELLKGTEHLKVFLTSTKGNEVFYRKLGFKKHINAFAKFSEASPFLVDEPPIPSSGKVDFKIIYQTHADDYETLISREDFQGNILKALQEILTFQGLEVVDMGAGTGRLTRMIATQAKTVWAFDESGSMLEIAQKKTADLGVKNCEFKVANNRKLPLRDGVADVALAGWAFGHSIAWYPDSWKQEIDLAIGEMTRVLKSEGTAIILETLGTGHETPFEPNQGLSDYYHYLETEKGFTRRWIRTDYHFKSLEEAQRLTRFFFGDLLADRVKSQKLQVLPECTGIWFKSLQTPRLDERLESR